MAFKKADPVTTAVPQEVALFEEAKKSLLDFEARHEKVFETYRELVAEYNTNLEQANAAVRSRGISTDDFHAGAEIDVYDADKLYEIVGREKFLELGGSEKTERKLSVDKMKLRSFILSGKVPPPVVDQIRSTQRKYTTPKPLKLA